MVPLHLAMANIGELRGTSKQIGSMRRSQKHQGAWHESLLERGTRLMKGNQLGCQPIKVEADTIEFEFTKMILRILRELIPSRTIVGQIDR